MPSVQAELEDAAGGHPFKMLESARHERKIFVESSKSFPDAGLASAVIL